MSQRARSIVALLLMLTSCASVRPSFTRTWLENAKPRIKEYDFSYEVGDETDRSAIRDASTVFAEELMLLMLEQNYE